MPGDFSHLVLCKAGLVMVRRLTGDLVLVDRQTLAAKCRVKLAGVEHIAASPASPLVFAPTGRKLRVIDLEAFTLQQELGTGEPITHPEVTPNGEYFFCAGEYQSAMRQFAVRGGGVVAAGTTSGGRNVQHVDVSANSKYAAVTFGGGAQPPAGYPAVSYATYVYNVDDLKPAMALYAGAYPHTVAVDPATGRFYSQNHDHPLIVFSAAGELENAYKWMNVGETQRLVVYPQGKKLLAISEKRIVWVELPDDLSRRN